MDYSTLKQQIVEDIKNDSGASAAALKQLIEQESANYQTVAEYSKVLGDSVSKSILNNIADGIPDDELGMFANECLAPIYRQSQDTMLNACKNVQKLYNKQAGIELNPIDVKRDESRIQHIVDRFDEAEKYDDVKFLTNANVARSITRGAVQDSIKANSRFQSESGLNVKISRSDGSGCCAWCSSVVGTYYDFDSLPDGFWGIHRGCKCVIDYRVGNTKNKISFKTDEAGNLSKVTEEINDKSYDNKSNNGIINSGAISGARNPFGDKAKEHAEKYYGLVRSMNTDVDKISKTTGISKEDIQSVKDFIFNDKHDLGGKEPERFTPDYMMAESWRRLIEGNPQKHDITMLNHELMEKKLMQSGASQDEAHVATSKIYNYSKEAGEFYAKITKYRKE